ncbi:MAG TPA: HEAT repeat domain-containing protein [Solirubrobacteraceae bacterium]|nr:HEAT repeat domain-containing protein [Solirubrobacteraceae bacterium]
MSKIAKITEQLSENSDVEHRRAAAGELRDLGFARRQNLEKRGTITEAAESDLPEHELEVLHTALEDQDPEVRRFTILAIGDLGDASSVPALLEHLQTDEPEIKLAAIDSLGDIGGVEGVAALSSLACDNEEDGDVRLAALTGLEELAAKQITSGPDRRFDPPSDLPSAVQVLEDPDETDAATAELARAVGAIEADTGAEDLLRLKAADVRAYLASDLSV